MIQRTTFTRAQIVRIARSYLDTDFHHQGRCKGVGVDCVGIITGVGTELGVPFRDFKGYGRLPDGHLLCEHLGKWMIEIPIEDRKAGDALIFRFGRRGKPRHVGIQTDTGIVHTWFTIGRVVEHRLDERWSKRIHMAFQFPGVED